MRRLAFAIPVAAALFLALLLALFLALWLAIDSEGERTTRSGASDLVSASRRAAQSDSESESAAGGENAHTVDAPADSILVLDASTRTPIEGALVVVSIDEEDEFVDDRELRLRTDRRGICVTNEKGGVDVVVYALGYTAGRVYATAPRAVTILLDRDELKTVQVVNVFSKRLPDAFASPDGAPELRVRADSQGRVTIGAGQSWDIGAPGYCSRIRDGRSGRCVLHEAYSMAGRVVDSSGHPVPGVALRPGFDLRSMAVSDSEGRFIVNGLNTGIHAITFDKEGYAHTLVDLWAGEQEASVVLYRSASVQCTVIGPDGHPAHGSEVWMPWRGDKEGPDVVFGRFAPGQFEIRASLDEALFHETTVTLSEGEHRVLTLVLKAPEVRSQVRVRVTDFSGRPVANARVRHRLNDDLTDANGEARLDLFADVGSDTEIVVGVPRALAGTVAARTLNVPSVALDSASEPVVIKLVRLVPFELEFVDAQGQPVVPRAVSVGTKHVIATGPRTWLAPEDARISASVYMRGQRFAPVRALKGLRPGSHRIVLHPPLVVVGRVVDREGRPALFADLDPRADELFLPHRTFLIENPVTREFHIMGFAYAGRLRVYLTLRDLPAAVLDLELKSGHKLDVGKVVLHEPIRLRGLVRDRDGAPLAGVSVLPLPDFDVRRGGYSSRADGTFDILESGLVTHFVLAKPGHGALLVPVASLRDVRLPAPGTIEIEENKRRLGWPRADGTVLWNDWRTPNRFDVAPGHYVVELEDAAGKKEQHKITVAAGEMVRVVGD